METVLKKQLVMLIAGIALSVMCAGQLRAEESISLAYTDARITAGPIPEVRTGSSVYYPTGTYYFSETDLRVAARSIPMVWDRTYRSNRIIKNEGKWTFAAPVPGDLGNGWTNVWLSRIDGDAFVNEEGKYLYFAKDANGNYLPNQKAGLTLIKTASGFQVNEAGGRTFILNTAGRLSAIKDQAGNAATLTYDDAGRLIAIQDVMGRQIFTFTHTAEGRIEKVTDLANRSISYEYDPFGNLITVKQPAKTVAVYTYNSSSGLTSKKNALGETYTIDYYPSWLDKGVVWMVIDPAGTELVRQGQSPTGHATTFSYDFTNRIFYVTEPSGVTSMHVLNADGLVVASYEMKDGAQIPQAKVEYLENRVTKTTDVMGNVTLSQADEWGNTIRSVDAAGFEWRSTYTADRRLLTTTDPLGTVTRYEYDASGNRTKETVAAGTPDESVATYTYNQYRERLTATRGTATSTYTYDDAGNLATIKDPLGSETVMTYDGTGNLLAQKLPLVGVTTYTDYDHQGNAGTVTDPNGVATTFTYDDLGRVKTATNQADGGITRYEYVTATTGSCTSCGGANGAGKLKSVVRPEGNRVDYEYDNTGNLTKIIDNDGNYLFYTYDLKGNRIKEEIYDAAGVLQKTLANQYDLLNRPGRTINPDDSYTEFGYDPRGNRSSLRNPNGNTTTYAYDAVDRLITVVQPGNIVTEYTYDRRNNLTSVKDASGNVTRYEYDKENRLTKTISPDTGTTGYTYDGNGNLKTRTDAKGVTATYGYDAMNRLLSISFPDPVDNVTYAYDSCLNGKGKVCSMADPSGVTTYEYTKKGQLAKETKLIDGQTFIIEYGYDKNGNNTTMKYPSGRIVTYTYSGDRVTQVLNNGTAVASNITYKPFGGLTALTYGNGIQQTNSYDRQYRVSSISATGVQDLTYGYDWNGNITSITDNLDTAKSKTYVYDALGRLTNATGPWGNLAYTYDGVGNRKTETNGGETIYSYQANRLIATTGAKQYSFGYDANGNTITENTKTYIYNQNQRLITVAEQQGVETVVRGVYAYTGNGQRAKKMVGGATTYFLYDQQGKMIVELGANQVEYLFLNGGPVAKLDGSTTYYFHNDHLGTPQKMTDAQKLLTWEMSAMPFGEAINIAGEATNNLRFPGQYYDAETGNHYNYFRDYDPKIGRYVQKDPIGLDGGDVNLYAYVHNSSVNKTDPFGLYDPNLPDNLPSLRNPPSKSRPLCEPKNKCRENADKFLSNCTKSLWAAQAGTTALCVAGCVGTGPGYLACVAECGYAAHRGFGAGRAGCWAAYLGLLAACNAPNS